MLNVGVKCKSITFLRLRHPVEFSYMLGDVGLGRVDSITDLRVVIYRKMSFVKHHIDYTVRKVLVMLRLKDWQISPGTIILLGSFMCHLCARSLSTQVLYGSLFMTCC
jgi:hypothetical protein